MNDRDVGMERKLSQFGFKLGQEVRVNVDDRGNFIWHERHTFDPDRKYVVGTIVGCSQNFLELKIDKGITESYYTHSNFKNDGRRSLHIYPGAIGVGSVDLSEKDKETSDKEQKMTNDQRIEKLLEEIGLKIGETVYFNKYSSGCPQWYPCEQKISTNKTTDAGVVVGVYCIEDKINPVVKFKSDPKFGWKQSEATKDRIHSKFLNDPNEPNYLWFEKNSFLKEKDINDENITTNLKKLGLEIGQEVYYLLTTTDGTTERELGKVIGCNLGIPIIALSLKHEKYGYGNKDKKGFVAKGIYSSFIEDKNISYNIININQIITKEQYERINNLVQAYIKSDLDSWKSQKNQENSNDDPESLIIPKTTPNNINIKNEFKKAGYRVAANQTMKLAQGMLISLLDKAGSNNAQIQAVSSLIATEYGRAALSIILGITLPNISIFENDSRLNELLREFRIGGMTLAGNELMETIFKSALDALISYKSEKEYQTSTISSYSLEESLELEHLNDLQLMAKNG